MLKNYLSEMASYVDTHIKNFIPQQFDDKWFEEYVGELNYGYNHESFKPIAKPIWDLLDRGGKRWRPTFMLLCCDVAGGGSKITDLVPLIELLHNGTLMIDDIEDSSDMRRGKPAVHHIYGVDVAVNTGNMMYFLPYMLIKRMNVNDKMKLKINEAVSEEMLKLHFGQAMDINWHNGKNGITEETYMQMCAFKTGTLSRLGARLGAIMGNPSKKQVDALVKFSENVGVAFQIQDDILNINITNDNWGKDLGDDITEGKRSLMAIYTLENATLSDKKRLLTILDSGTKDKVLIKEAISLMEKYNALDYAKAKAKKMVEKSWKEFDSFFPESESKEKLRMFADFVVNRDI